MKETTTLKDFQGRIIGYIETDEKGNQIIKDFYHRIRGKYDKATNTTRDFYGRIIGRGNILTTLLNR